MRKWVGRRGGKFGRLLGGGLREFAGGLVLYCGCRGLGYRFCCP